MWPGPLGATMITFTFFGGTMVLKWIEKPCENSSVLPGARFGAMSFSIGRWPVWCPASATKITSARFTASAVADHFKALFLGDGNGLAAFVKADDDVEAAVLEVQRVGMALGAKAEHGERFIFQHAEIGVFVGIDFCGISN